MAGEILDSRSGALEQYPVADEITKSIRVFLTVFVRRWYIFVLFIIISLGLSVAYLRFAKPYYDVRASIMPSATSNLNGKNGDLAALASIAGVNVSTGGAPLFARYRELITSSRLAKKLINDPELLEALFPNEYDPKTRSFRQPEGALGAVRTFVLVLIGRSPDVAMSPERISRMLVTKFEFKEIKSSPVVTVIFRDRDPRRGERVLSKILIAADQILKGDDSIIAQNYVDFILRKSPSISDIAIKESLSTLLGDYEKITVMSGVDAPYGALMVDTPSAPNQPDGPSPIIVIGVGLILALVAAAGVALLSLRADRAAISRGWL